MQQPRKMSIASQNLMSFTAEATGRNSYVGDANNTTRTQSYTDEFLSRLECDDIKASAAAAVNEDEESSDEYSDDDEDHPLDVEVADAMLASIPRGGRRRRRRKKRRSRVPNTLRPGGSLLSRIGACLAVSTIIAVVCVAIFAGVRKLPSRGGDQDTAASGIQEENGGNDTSSTSFPIVPPPPSDLDVLCDVSNVETPDGYAACEEACRPADCCFWHGEGANCKQRGSTNLEVCDEYEPCVLALTAYKGDEEEEEDKDKDAARPPSFGPTTDTPNNGPSSAGTGVDEICSTTRLAGDEGAISACRTECHKRACCFSSGVLNCSAQRSSWCSEYSACDRLQSLPVNGGSQGGGATGGGGGGDGSAFEVEELVAESCSSDIEMATPEGLADCHDVCLPGKCCFPDEDGSVRECKDDDDGDFCRPYAGCAGIFRHFASSTGQGPKPEVDVEDDDVHNLILGPDGEEEEDDDVHNPLPDEEDDDVHPHIPNMEEEEDDDVHPHSYMPGGLDEEEDDDVHNNNLILGPEEEEDDDVHDPQNNVPEDDDDYDDPYGVDRPPDADDDQYDPESGNYGDGKGHGHVDDDVYDAPRDPRDEDDDYVATLSTKHELPLQVKIALSCSESNLVTKNGKADCYQVCEAGSCCFPTSTNASSGRKDEEDDQQDCSADYCNAYEGCDRYYRDHHHVQDKEETTSTTSKVMDQVATSCSSSSLATDEGRSACGDACIAGSCCFPDPDEVGDVDCTKRAGGFCLTYAGCGDYYRQHGWQKQQSSQSGGGDEVVRPPAGNDDDLDDDDDGGVGGAVDPSVGEVEEACSPDKLRTPLGLEGCKMVCAERACCFEERGGPFSCYAEMTRWCVEYEGPCRAMIRYVEGEGMEGGGSDGAAADSSAGSSHGSADDDALMEALAEGKVEGDDDIAKEDDIHDDDVHDDDFVKGSHMEDVEDDDVVEEGDDDVVAKGSDSDSDGEYEVNVACAEDKLSTAAGRAACEELCSERACCFDESRSGCYDEKPVWCEEYIVCNALYVESTSGGDAYRDDEQGTAADDVSGANVKSVCSPENVRTEKGLAACTELCSERSCCFMGDMPGSCREDRRGWCSEYRACEGVYVADPNNPNPSNEAASVQAACSDESLATGDGLILCTELCSERSCCFAQGISESCYEDRTEWCDEYKVCEGVYIGDASDNDADANEGTSVPGRDPATTAGSGTTAVDEGGITLDEASDINVACSPESLNTSAGLILCTGLCNERACCFMRGTASCYGGKSEWCDEYKICDSVYIDGNA